jgi:hypothetical protein
MRPIKPSNNSAAPASPYSERTSVTNEAKKDALARSKREQEGAQSRAVASRDAVLSLGTRRVSARRG